jgi:hypothetical protein
LKRPAEEVVFLRRFFSDRPIAMEVDSPLPRSAQMSDSVSTCPITHPLWFANRRIASDRKQEEKLLVASADLRIIWASLQTCFGLHL